MHIFMHHGSQPIVYEKLLKVKFATLTFVFSQFSQTQYANGFFFNLVRFSTSLLLYKDLFHQLFLRYPCG